MSLRIPILSENQDELYMEASEQGLHIAINPAGSIYEDDAYDIFTIGLRRSNVKKLARALHYGQKYWTDDHVACIWQDGPKIHMSFRMFQPVSDQYIVDLDESFSDVFRGILEYMINKIPPEFKELFGFKDIELLAHLLKGLSNKTRLTTTDYWNQLGSIVGTIGEIDLADQYFHKSLEIDPNSQGALANLAVNEKLRGNFEKALDLIQKTQDGIKRRNLFMGQILTANERKLEAIPFFESAIQEEPDFYIPYLNLLEVLEELEHPSFEFWIDRALAIAPQSPQISWFVSKHLFHTLRLEELVGLDWIQDLSPSDERLDVIGRDKDSDRYVLMAGLYQLLAKVYLSDDMDALAMCVDRVVNADHDWHLCEFAKLILYPAVSFGNLDQIRAVYPNVCHGCIEHEIGVPKYIETLLAQASVNLGDHREAVSICESVLQVQDDHVDTLNTYWWSLDELNNLDGAIAAAEKLSNLEPEYDWIFYNLGYLCGKNGQFGKAEHYYQKQINQTPTNIKALENLSIICLLTQKLDVASELFETCVKIHQESWQPFYTDDPEIPFNREVYEQDELMKKKELHFNTLYAFARENLGSTTYAYDLEQLNNTAEVTLGAFTTVGRTRPSLDNILTSLSSHTPESEKSDVRYFLEMQQRGDHSIYVRAIKEKIPNYDRLPPPAQASMIEGEKRLADPTGGDYSMAVLSFCKAVEIALKTMVLEPFRNKFQLEIEIDQIKAIRVNTPKSLNKAQKFLLFVEKGYFLGLGEAAITLELLDQPEAAGNICLANLSHFIRTDLQSPDLLEENTIMKLRNLSRDFRNRAAHAATFDRESALQAKAISAEILATLQGTQ